MVIESISFVSFAFRFLDSMRRRAPATLLSIVFFLFLFGFLSLYHFPGSIPADLVVAFVPSDFNHAIRERDLHVRSIRGYFALPPAADGRQIGTDAVLWPGWEILTIVPPGTDLPETEHACVFPNGAKALARVGAVLSFSNRTAFKCELPFRYRRRHPIPRPVVLPSLKKEPPLRFPPPGVPLWNYIVFDSVSTENDVVLFVKGLNRGLRSNRRPEQLKCVFGDDPRNGALRTAMTSSVQEVFRCAHPNVTPEKPVKVSIEIVAQNNTVVPSVAYYTPRRTIAETRPKSLVCAATMVYNVGKFLREWVMYHSSIGVERFMIYDNESDDGLESVVAELNREGYEIDRVPWIWPKTQEAGFSHAAVRYNDSCTWMMFLDVDEFLFSPSWQNSSQPSDQMIKSLLTPRKAGLRIGQVSFKSNEFGPSNQTVHPKEGVTQGYTCRRSEEQRHKSVVRLDAVEHSLFTAIHHFGLREGFEWEVVRSEVAVVNHYKYQAWEEFKAKFRRRVSAYVVDWTRRANLKSRDRTPGLETKAIEPKGWAQKFCEVRDERLKRLTRRWFGSSTGHGYKMVWQR